MTENAKMNFFKKFILSIKDLDKYDQLAIQPIRKGISYFFKLIILLAMILSIMYVVQTYQLFTTLQGKINDIPDFEYKNGELSFKENEEPILLENLSSLINSILILPDSNNSKSKEYIAKAKTYNSYLTLNKSDFSISIKDNTINFNYKDFFENNSINSFEKKDVKNILNSINHINLIISMFIVITIYLFVFNFISIGLDIVVTFLVSYITSKLARIKLKSSAFVNISIHSLTLPVLLYLIYYIINVLTGFEIKNFRIMYILVASIYASISVLIIKADFIDRQIELAKVIKEQQAIRKEMDNEENDNNTRDTEEEKNNVEEPKEDQVEEPTESVNDIKEENN